MLSLIRKYTRRFYENNRNLVLLLTSLSALGVFYAPIYLKYKKDSKDPIKRNFKFFKIFYFTKIVLIKLKKRKFLIKKQKSVKHELKK